MVCHFFVFFAVAENFRLCFSVLFCLSLVLFFCQVAKNFRLRFFVFGSCSFVRLLNFSGSGFFCFFLLSQVVSFFSVSFLFLSLWFSFFLVLFSQAVVFFVRLWFYFFLFSSLFRLWFWFCFLVLCPLLLSGCVLLSCAFCLCQVVKFLGLWSCGVLFFLLFSGCNVLFCSG